MKQLILLLLILVPAAIYLGYVLTTGPTAQRLKRGPWIWLLVGGVVLYAIALGFWALSADPAGGDYVPPRMEDGRIVPGQHINPDETADPDAGDGGAGDGDAPAE